MKVVHVFKDFYPPLAAGITRYIRDVADAAAIRGVEVDVHVAGVRKSRRDVLPSGVVVHRHRELGRVLSSPLAPGLMRGFWREADILHLHMPNPLGELGAVLGTRAVPMVASFHAQLGRQQFLEPVYGPVRRVVLRRASKVLVSCDQMAAVAELATARDKIHVLPYGVSPSLNVDGHSRTADGDVLRVLFIGRLVYYKGLDILLRALPGVENSTVTIVGEGPLRAELEELATSLGLGSAVRFLGSVDDNTLRNLYLTHDVFVLPSVSRAEAFGLAMIEAMASGMPVVSTTLGTGTDWVNLDKESGLVVPAGDVERLGLALSCLRSPILRAQLGQGARQRVLRFFSFERHVDELMAIYQQLASGTPVEGQL